MTISEQQLDNLIESVPNYLTEKNVIELSSKSDWDILSCRWFVWKFKYGIKSSLTAYASVQFNKIVEYLKTSKICTSCTSMQRYASGEGWFDENYSGRKFFLD